MVLLSPDYQIIMFGRSLLMVTTISRGPQTGGVKFRCLNVIIWLSGDPTDGCTVRFGLVVSATSVFGLSPVYCGGVK